MKGSGWWPWVRDWLRQTQWVGAEQLQSITGAAILVANHRSERDWLYLVDRLSGHRVMAVVHPGDGPSSSARAILLRAFSFVVVDPLNPHAVMAEKIVPHLHSGGWLLVFPQGMAEEASEALLKLAIWPLQAARQSRATVVPLHVQQRPVSTVTVGTPVAAASLPDHDDPARLSGWLADLLSHVALTAAQRQYRPLWQQLSLVRRRGHSSRISDSTGAVASRAQLQQRALILVGLLQRQSGVTDSSGPIGLLLPTSLAALTTLLAVQAMGRTVAMLNFTSGSDALLHGCQVAAIRTVITARQFVAKARLQHLVEPLQSTLQLLFLEDLRHQLRWYHVLQALFEDLCLRDRYLGPVKVDDAAVILFTSGSEGQPKGVVLSHANLLANLTQAALRIDLTADDGLLNALPMFHAFGLTLGTLAPLFCGMRLHLVPSPLEYRTIAATAYTIRATILAGANTFLAGYGKVADPCDFHTLRYVFAGAEALRPETQRLWQERFGLRILEGYGTTEASPVVAVNTPAACRSGSVGRMVPGMTARLQPVPGLIVPGLNGEAGRLLIAGPNIMRGYLLAQQPGVPIAPVAPDDGAVGWYDTGDIVRIDEAGFITLLGRAKRFAKIGGEMVSLTSLEQLAAQLWPDDQHAAIQQHDSVRGEQIVLVSSCAVAERQALLLAARQQGLSDLLVPRQIHRVENLPLTGSGKIDYQRLLQMVL
ncbi:MAG: AMP-binding protein [Magnetococcales bacterium]|nr:AMP-binding protein [Magnetococcales bacterium]